MSLIAPANFFFFKRAFLVSFLGVRLDLLNFRNPRILRIKLEPMKIRGVAGARVDLLFSGSPTILQDGPQSAKGTAIFGWTMFTVPTSLPPPAEGQEQLARKWSLADDPM